MKRGPYLYEKRPASLWKEACVYTTRDLFKWNLCGKCVQSGKDS